MTAFAPMFNAPVFKTPVCFHFPMEADAASLMGPSLTRQLLDASLGHRFENSRVLKKEASMNCYYVIGRGYAGELEWSVGQGPGDADIVTDMIRTGYAPTIYTVNYGNVLGVSLHAVARRTACSLAPIGQWTMIDMMSLALPSAVLSLKDRAAPSHPSASHV